MTGPLLDARGLTKRFGDRRGLRRRGPAVVAVDSVDLEVGRGETVAVVGESGSGKTTLARLLLRLVEPDEGRVTFDGVDLGSLGPRALRAQRRRMQMVFQDPFSSLDPRLTVGATVEEALHLHTDLDREGRRRRARELLERVGLAASLADRRPAELSGGQLQRVSIARALVPDPSLLVCDEPVAALDVSVRAQVINVLADLQEERGMSYVFITHDLSLVPVIADRVAVMHRGRVVERAPAPVLFTEPAHPYTQLLLAAVPGIDPTRRSLLRTAGAPRVGGGAPEPPDGCRFVGRCPLAEPRCSAVVPALRPAGGPGHEVACHVVADGAGEAPGGSRG